jgi:hypothetical protein
VASGGGSCDTLVKAASQPPHNVRTPHKNSNFVVRLQPINFVYSVGVGLGGKGIGLAVTWTGVPEALSTNCGEAPRGH